MRHERTKRIRKPNKQERAATAQQQREQPELPVAPALCDAMFQGTRCSNPAGHAGDHEFLVDFLDAPNDAEPLLDFLDFLRTVRAAAPTASIVVVPVPAPGEALSAVQRDTWTAAITRLDDAGADGMDLIREIRSIYDNYPELKTQVLAASIRNVLHVKQAAMIGADAATMPATVLRALVQHPLTDRGLELFLADWKKTGQQIA